MQRESLKAFVGFSLGQKLLMGNKFTYNTVATGNWGWSERGRERERDTPHDRRPSAAHTRPPRARLRPTRHSHFLLLLCVHARACV